MNYNVISYFIYLPITFCVTIWVANTLLKNGRVFLSEIFKGNLELAGSVNKLLQVGFYLINLGYTLTALTVTSKLVSLQGTIEKLSLKIGAILLILGAMHFFNLFILFRLKRKASNQ